MSAASIILSVLLYSCPTTDNNRAIKTINKDSLLIINSVPASKKLRFHKLDKLFITGDFNGDGKQDSLFQHNFSGRTKAEIDSCPDPFYNDWESVVGWFYDQEASVYLTFNRPGFDTLPLGSSLGLYCLINIGDNNADGKAEIALVNDYGDFSQANSCYLYTICKHKWVMVKSFGIHEGAFVFNSDTLPVFTSVKGFLEQRNNHWWYEDYRESMKGGISGMKKLAIPHCR